MSDMRFSEYAAKVMGKRSVGILLCKKDDGEYKFFIVHPGGPYYVNKWDGFWDIPKGAIEPGERDEDTARREFKEETGFAVTGRLFDLGETVLNTGKVVKAFLAFGDGEFIKSNDFEMEWPPKSGKKQMFPEIDKGEWHSLKDCKRMIGINKICFLDRAAAYLDEVQ